MHISIIYEQQVFVFFMLECLKQVFKWSSQYTETENLIFMSVCEIRNIKMKSTQLVSVKIPLQILLFQHNSKKPLLWFSYTWN